MTSEPKTNLSLPRSIEPVNPGLLEISVSLYINDATAYIDDILARLQIKLTSRITKVRQNAMGRSLFRTICFAAFVHNKINVPP